MQTRSNSERDSRRSVDFLLHTICTSNHQESIVLARFTVKVIKKEFKVRSGEVQDGERSDLAVLQRSLRPVLLACQFGDFALSMSLRSPSHGVIYIMSYRTHRLRYPDADLKAQSTSALLFRQMVMATSIATPTRRPLPPTNADTATVNSRLGLT